MKRERFWYKIIAMILSLLAFLSGTACTEPETPQEEPPALESWKHQAKNTTATTVVSFLDTPDSVTYVTDRFGRVEIIPAERQVAVCAAFAAFRRDPAHLDGFLLCGAVSQSDIADMMSELGGYAIEYRYDQRRRYEGELVLEETGANILTEAVEYDAVLWFPVSGTFLLYRDGQYFGIQDGWYTFEVLTPLYARFEQALAVAVESFTVRYPEYDGNYAFHHVVDARPIETATLLECPDSVALVEGYPYIKSFSDEECEAIWEAFATLSLTNVKEGTAQTAAWYALPPDDVEIRLPYIARYGIELRYDQRRVFTGELLAADGTSVTVEAVEYDAVLWLPDYNGDLAFLLYKDGEYFGLDGRWYVFELSEEAFETFYEQIKAEAEQLRENPYD